MTTLLMLFLLSTVLALLLTPAVRALGNCYGWVDQPSARTVHAGPIPRIGGVAICLAFFLPFLGGFAYPTQLTVALVTSSRAHWIVVGAALVFLVGLIDDVHRLRPGIKLAAQMVAALLAYRGGIEFGFLQLPWGSTWSFGWLALPATLFWFLLVINAINLIDGLDGLAAGITLFASLVLLGLCLMDGRYRVAMGFAALAGSCLGFLRYNFNPASIFMGDSGSYFLGYMLAALSMLGSMKSQATVAILIPMVALGVPLMDTLLAPIRRFVVGEALFKADKGHIHHTLMKLGLSHRMAVLTLYGITIAFGGFTMLIVHLRDQRAGLLLLILSVLVILGMGKIGYMRYWSRDKLVDYLRDVVDVMGLTNDRRTFLNFQIAIGRARDLEQMWECIGKALEFLAFDYGVLCLNGSALHSGSGIEGKDSPFTYRRNGQAGASSWDHKTLCIDLPLVAEDKSIGTLHLEKVVMDHPINYHTLRRIEQLRRSVVRRLAELEKEAGKKGESSRLQVS